MIQRYIIQLVMFCGFFQYSIAQQTTNKRLKTELSLFLSKAYFNFNFGSIYYPYTNENLNEGYTASGTKMNTFSARLLLGYKLKPNLAMQFGVMRPASWFKFKDIEYKGQESSVWVNMWSLSLKKSIPLAPKTDIYFELGLGNFTRVGVYTNKDIPIYNSTHYMTPVFGAGIQYSLNKKWDLIFNATYLPEVKKKNQPLTFQSTIGAVYNLQQVPKKDAEKYESDSAYFFPKQFIQIGYGSGEVGFFANRFFSAKAKVGNFESLGIPIFWHGDVLVKSVFSASYQRTAFRTKRYFSLDWGASFTYFSTFKNSSVFAISVFPVLRFYLWRAKNFALYSNYSIIGPTYMSKSNIDEFRTGAEFTYQDFMGFGAFFGSTRQFNFDMKIMHYSNGNIYTHNAGVAVPIVFSFGITL